MDEILAIEVEGEQLEQILLNGKFVSEGIKAFDGDGLSIEFNGPFGAVVMRMRVLGIWCCRLRKVRGMGI